MRHFIAILLLLCTSLGGWAQPTAIFEHYSVEDGLSDNTVLCMYQDQRGLMWFGTFDGLNKFDGYRFKSYKALQNRANNLNNSRVDYITSDCYGFLWLITYNGKVHRFDPRNENFICVPDFKKQMEGIDARANKLHVYDSATVWITSAASGCFRVTTDPEDYSMEVDHFSVNNRTLPSNVVNDIFRDKGGSTWIMTAAGIAKHSVTGSKPHIYTLPYNSAANVTSAAEFDTYILFATKKHGVLLYDKHSDKFSNANIPTSARILNIHRLSGGRVMIAGSDNTILICDRALNIIRRFDSATNSGLTFDAIDTPQIYTDRYGECWIELSDNRVGTLDSEGTQLRVLSVEADKTGTYALPNFLIFEDKADVLWVSPSQGGFCYYDRQQRKLQPFYNAPYSPSRLFTNRIHSAFSDSQGNLWFCTYSRGIDKAKFLEDQFELHTITDDHRDVFGNEVRAIMEDSKGNLWIASKQGEIFVQDAQGNKLGNLCADGSICPRGATIRASIYAIMEDSKGRIWLGSKGNGLYMLERKSNLKFAITLFEHHPTDPYSLSDKSVYTVHEDNNGRIWVGTYGGGINYIDEGSSQKKFINYNNLLKNYPATTCNKVRYITSDAQGYIWVGSTNGIVVFEGGCKDPAQIEFNYISHNPMVENSLSAYDIHYILPTKDDELYIATFGGGLNKLIGSYDPHKTPQFTSHTTHSGFASDIILNLVQDKDKKLWMSTEKAILKFDPQTNSVEKYGVNSGVNSAFMSEAAATRLSNGDVVIGASDGYYRFTPDKINKSHYVPKIVFSRFQLFNKDVDINQERAPIHCEADYAETITLHPRQSVFSIEYAALDYSDPSSIEYAYRLDGFEPQWNNVGKQRNATYTNLPKGKYTFMVRSTNAEGVWVDNVRSIDIVVLPTFWQTFWGYGIMLLALMLIVCGTTYLLFIFYRLRERVNFEQKMTDMKLRFFTDISHELRTPLTLIASPIEHLLKNANLTDDVHEQLSIVYRNVGRMLRLVTQILDFRKIQNKKMTLKIEQVDLGKYVKSIYDNFGQTAQERQIEFLMEDRTHGDKIWIDKDKMEIVLFNLLSNAFKFSDANQTISIVVDRYEGGLSVAITDHGRGMSKEIMDKLFVRFNSFDHSQNAFNHGTGIGLSLTKELVDMHKGQIIVDSEPGKGSRFEIRLCNGIRHFEGKPEYIISDGQNPMQTPAPTTHIESTHESQQDQTPTILIAEDNDELRTFLAMVLSADYHVMEANNGQTAMDMTLKHVPDIIISDILMPCMDGLELARQIKNDERISHIPIILLTAMTDDERRIEAMRSGADDYITKPFSATYLQARVENLLEQRRKLQMLYRQDLYAREITPSRPHVQSSDEIFLNKLMTFMEENIDNSELEVDDLVPISGFGRSFFFKKLKSLTGLAPIEYIREVRVKRAAQLIESGEYNISEITYMVGISDPRYFSRLFKKRFGLTPSEYKEQFRHNS